MGTIASQITSLTSVYSTVYSGADQSKHQSSASLAFVWGIHREPVNSPHKWPVTRKMFPFDDVIMKNVIFKQMKRFEFLSVSCEADDRSALVPILAYCRQQQAITRAKVDPDLYRHMASLGPTKLSESISNGPNYMNCATQFLPKLSEQCIHSFMKTPVFEYLTWK